MIRTGASSQMDELGKMLRTQGTDQDASRRESWRRQQVRENLKTRAVNRAAERFQKFEQSPVRNAAEIEDENMWKQKLDNLLRDLISGGESGKEIGQKHANRVFIEFDPYTDPEVQKLRSDQDWLQIIKIATKKFGAHSQHFMLQGIIENAAKKKLATQIGETSQDLSFVSVKAALSYLMASPPAPVTGEKIRQHIHAARQTCKKLEVRVIECERSLDECTSELSDTQQAVKSAVAFAKDFQSMLVALGKVDEVNIIRARVSSVGPINGKRLFLEEKQGTLLLTR